MVLKYKIVCITGVEGIKYYKNYKDAKQAADLHTNLTGLKWIVKPIVLR